jgi:hypothetical protein
MLALLAKIGIGTIVDRLAAAYEAREKARNDRERIVAEERIKALEARRDVQIAEAPSRINTVIRALFALPVAVYFAKIFLWDKVLGLGTTDALSPELEQVAWAIIGFYFLLEGSTQVARIAKRK